MIDAQHHQKVTPDHLKRNAYLYVRQSTLRQVFENTESTKRQYALKERAVALGWPIERVIVLDHDQGQSGASAVDRAGFQTLVSEVGLGRAGIVLGLEVSRLARNSTDWHRLLEICALSGTLILDEDGLYDPSHFNDRLLLGLKGTMSEAELHVLKARLQGGIRAKARRGELESPVPIGFVYDANHRVILDPDKQVQDSVKLFFVTFERTGSATATVKYMRENGIKWPRRPRCGPHRGELLWSDLPHHRALWILHNPRYAGAFFYGRTKQGRSQNGVAKHRKIPRDEWLAFKKDAHPCYITWDTFEANLARLKQNSMAHGHDRRRSPPREGPALLQGLVICGKCGKRMTVRYHMRDGKQIPDYICQKEGIERGGSPCQGVPGDSIDNAIGEALVDSVTPMALEVSLQVQSEVESRVDRVVAFGRQHVERARYEADLARRRFMQVDPDNRLVADTLEAEWNAKLKVLNSAQEEFETKKKIEFQVVTSAQRQEILRLASDFPKLWRDPSTTDRDRKRMARLILDDVTITRNEGITVAARFKGGATRTYELPKPKSAWEIRKTSPEIIKDIDRLLDDHTPEAIAEILNAAGKKSGMGRSFDRIMVHQLRIAYRLHSHATRLKRRGYLTTGELAKNLRVSHHTIKKWVSKGVLAGTKATDKNELMFMMPDDGFLDRVSKSMKRGGQGIFVKKLSQALNEV